MKHTGNCFCGAVQVQVTGSPEGMGYCHCSSCRSWSGGPVNAFTLWKPEAVEITSGKQHVATFEKTPMSQRKYCAKCGGHLMTNHPTLGLVDVFAATLPTLAFTPGVHVNYADTVLPMRDGLPKLKDFPAELGGSGEAPQRTVRGAMIARNNAARFSGQTRIGRRSFGRELCQRQVPPCKIGVWRWPCRSGKRPLTTFCGGCDLFRQAK
jgi:hypothetical protein